MGDVGLGSEGFLWDPVTDVAKEAELVNHRIGVVSTVLDWTKDGLRRLKNMKR